MKKLTLSIGLLAAILSANAQDTSCTYFVGKDVYEFNYYTSEPISYKLNEDRFYTIEVGDSNVLCLDFSDNKNRVRKVITTYPDGYYKVQILDSKNESYYTGFGPLKVEVGKPYLMIGVSPSELTR